jgi:GT2 family glycosyltransferase
MAFRKSVWEELGGLCGLYGFYDEDIDFGLRARRAGYRVVFQPDAAVYHYCNTRPKVPMTKHKAFLMGRNRCMTLVRNDGVSLRLLAYLLTAPWIRLWEALREIGLQCKTSLGHWAAHGAGVVAGLFMGWRHPPRRDAWTKAE